MPYNAGGPVTGYKGDVGPGWDGLLDQLHAELIAVDPDYQTVQVKEKFGNLRVYVREGTEQVWDILGKYERLSSQTCENCGAPGRHTDTPWIKTLCDPCAELRQADRRPFIGEMRERQQ